MKKPFFFSVPIIHIFNIVFDFFFVLAVVAPLLLMNPFFFLGVNTVFLYYKIISPRYEKNELLILTTVTFLDATYYSLFL